MTTIRYEIIKYAQTRSTQYTMRDLIKAIQDCNVPYSIPKPGELGCMILTATLTAPTHAELIQLRKRFDNRLQIVHKNIQHWLRVTVS